MIMAFAACEENTKKPASSAAGDVFFKDRLGPLVHFAWYSLVKLSATSLASAYVGRVKQTKASSAPLVSLRMPEMTRRADTTTGYNRVFEMFLVKQGILVKVKVETYLGHHSGHRLNNMKGWVSTLPDQVSLPLGVGPKGLPLANGLHMGSKAGTF